MEGATHNDIWSWIPRWSTTARTQQIQSARWCWRSVDLKLPALLSLNQDRALHITRPACRVSNLWRGNCKRFSGSLHGGARLQDLKNRAVKGDRSALFRRIGAVTKQEIEAKGWSKAAFSRAATYSLPTPNKPDYIESLRNFSEGKRDLCRFRSVWNSEIYAFYSEVEIRWRRYDVSFFCLFLDLTLGLPYCGASKISSWDLKLWPQMIDAQAVH